MHIHVHTRWPNRYIMHSKSSTCVTTTWNYSTSSSNPSRAPTPQRCVAACCTVFREISQLPPQIWPAQQRRNGALQRVAAYCSVLQHIAVCCSILQCAARLVTSYVAIWSPRFFNVYKYICMCLLVYMYVSPGIYVCVSFALLDLGDVFQCLLSYIIFPMWLRLLQQNLFSFIGFPIWSSALDFQCRRWSRAAALLDCVLQGVATGTSWRHTNCNATNMCTHADFYGVLQWVATDTSLHCNYYCNAASICVHVDLYSTFECRRRRCGIPTATPRTATPPQLMCFGRVMTAGGWSSWPIMGQVATL